MSSGQAPRFGGRPRPDELAQPDARQQQRDVDAAGQQRQESDASLDLAGRFTLQRLKSVGDAGCQHKPDDERDRPPPADGGTGEEREQEDDQGQETTTPVPMSSGKGSRA